MKLPLLTAIICCVFTFKVIAQTNQLNTVPVTLNGSFFDHTNLVHGINNNYKATDVVGFVYVPSRANPWVQIPIQIDERDTVNAGKIYNTKTWVDTAWSKGYSPSNNPTGGYYSHLKTLQYCDPNTYTGRDRYPAFDVDDELSFMLRDMGDVAAPPNIPLPAGVDTTSGVETKSLNVVTQKYNYIYLFNRLPNSGLVPSANKSYITSYVFKFSHNGVSYGPEDYKEHYNMFTGPNPESSSVVTPYYHRGFSDRWIDDTLKIDTGISTPINLYDKHSLALGPGSCGRSENTFSGEDTLNRPSAACNFDPVPQSEGAFVTNIIGPVRAIRSCMGSNSGPLTQNTHIFYSQMEVIITDVRVHPIGGLLQFYDYNPAAGTMIYNNNNNNPATHPEWATNGGNGLLINGIPDVSWKNGPLIWELINSSAGSIFRFNFINTNIPLYKVGSKLPTYYPQSYYLDNYNAQADAAKNGGVTCQCTGDSHAWGASGMYLTPTPNPNITAYLPVSDPRQSGHYKMENIQINVYLPPTAPQTDTSLWIASTRQLAKPAAAIVSNWPRAYIASGKINFYPNPNDGIVNVDITGNPNEGIKVIFYNAIGRQIYSTSGLGALRESVDLNARGGGGQL